MNTLCQRFINASNMACRLRVDGLIIHFSERETERDRDRQTNGQTVSHFSYLSSGSVFVQKIYKQVQNVGTETSYLILKYMLYL